MTRAPASPALQLAALLAFYGAATLLALAVFTLLMRSGAFAAFPIMFYRGLVALGVTGALMLALLAWAARRGARLGLSFRDALSAVIVALALNVAFFTLGPVTVDRSISVFMLSRFDKADKPITAREVRDAFVATYVDGWSQMERRLAEQKASGNLVETPEGWRITAQGRAFMASARTMSRWFGGDPRFVDRPAD